MRSLFSLNKYFLKYKWRFILGIIFVAVSNVFAIIPAQIIRESFDVIKEGIELYQLSIGFDASSDLTVFISHTIVIFVIIVLVMAILKGVFLFFMRQTIIVMSRYIEYDLKNEIFNHYQKLDLEFFKRNNTGDLMNRISEDVSRVRMYLGPAIMYTINMVVLFIMVIGTMISVNPMLTLYSLLPLPILSVTIYYVSSTIHKKSEAVQEEQSRLSTLGQEAFSGIRILKAYSRESYNINKFNDSSIDYKIKALNLAKTNALFHPFMILLIGLSTILTIFIGGILTMKGEISTGNIAEFVIYVNMLTWPVAAIGWVTSLIQRAAASQKRINEFLDENPKITNTNTNPFSFKSKIVFDKVSFKYPDSGIHGLKNVSFNIERGQSIGIIGKTGSGKSTLTHLLLRLYETTSGRILIDEQDIKNINLGDYRNTVGYVPQDVFLFSDTIANNIALGLKDEHNEEKVTNAAKMVCMDGEIKDFPQSYSTILGERGITLSGGQKQRLAIARALIREPDILLLDDCLSAVDTETEENILMNLKQFMKDRTSVIVSHRVSSIRFTDFIIVLKDGEIIQNGSHKELLIQEGYYKELYQKQLQEENKKNYIAGNSTSD